jgi:CRISP-associated protein Cas1
VTGNVPLRRAQYRAAEAPDEIVRGFVLGKIANQHAVLMRGLRDHGDELDSDRQAALAEAVDRLERILRRANIATEGIDAPRGHEGEAASIYFSVFDDLIRVTDPALRFRGRSRRPLLDAVNGLLSFLYTLLTHDCRSAAESVGLDPAVGFLHRDRPGRPGLALDLMRSYAPCSLIGLSFHLLIVAR